MAEKDDLLLLRNEIIQAPVGDVLFRFLHNKITDYATKNLDAIEIKGMCRLVQDLKNIPEVVQKMK